jgi:hypothetical protein
MLNTFRIPERYPTLLHYGSISYSLFVRSLLPRTSPHLLRLAVLA